MKKILFLLVLVSLIFSCQKKENDPPQTMQEVSFNALEINPAGLKSTEGIYDCYEYLSPDYATVVISTFDEPFYPKVFRLDGKLYTQAIKLYSGTYTVEHFLLMDDMNTPDILSDDQIYMAIPEAGSMFSAYANPVAPFEITVTEFVKSEVKVELLCFQPDNYQLFGFDWFSITEIVVREQCFFGDICVTPGDYVGSLYDTEQMPPGCQVDMSAIIKIIVLKDGVAVPYSPFTNATEAAGYGVGSPLCVQYPDNLNISESFTFQLYVLVKSTVPGVFLYQLYHTFVVNDDDMIANGGDGIIDFTIGDCSPDADYIFPWLDPQVPD